MYSDIPLWLSLVFMFGGLAALAWSSDLFVDGAAAVAKILGISPFIIGMVIIGFGTSAPELCVSAMSGMAGHANLSLGNAYGSCIFNIAVILGVAVMIMPLVVKPAVAFVAGPLLALTAGASLWILRDGYCSRAEAIALLVAFAILLPGYCWFDQMTKREAGVPVDAESLPRQKKDERRSIGRDEDIASTGRDEDIASTGRDEDIASTGRDEDIASTGRGETPRLRLLPSLLKVAIGLAVLVGSSHYLVWGAVDFAKMVGVSDLVIGLTIVAAGTSLPELASAIQSARRGEHEFVLGNIVGSNFFNTLAVVGLATAISPTGDFSPCILSRDLPLMIFLSLTITLFGINWKHPKWPGAINRLEAGAWLLIFVGYTALMIFQETICPK